MILQGYTAEASRHCGLSYAPSIPGYSALPRQERSRVTRLQLSLPL
jgi:hypothetical protein